MRARPESCQTRSWKRHGVKSLATALLVLAGAGWNLGCSKRHDSPANGGGEPDAATPAETAGRSGTSAGRGGSGGATSSAAGSSAKPSDDPGDPGLMFGTLAGADLKVSDTQVGRIAFTVLAPKADDRAHLFARPDMGERMGVSEYYVSLVFDRATWQATTYDSAVAGRVSFELTNGKRYAGDADELEVELIVDRAVEAEIGEEMYLKGKLTLTIPAETAGEAPLSVEAVMQ